MVLVRRQFEEEDTLSVVMFNDVDRNRKVFSCLHYDQLVQTRRQYGLCWQAENYLPRFRCRVDHFHSAARSVTSIVSVVLLFVVRWKRRVWREFEEAMMVAVLGDRVQFR